MAPRDPIFGAGAYAGAFGIVSSLAVFGGRRRNADSSEGGEGRSVENVKITFPFGLWWLWGFPVPSGPRPPRVQGGARS